MIKFNYDEQTAGIRVSFVIKDGVHSSCDCKPLTSYPHTIKDGVWILSQNSETLQLVQSLLETQMKSEVSRELRNM